MGEADAAAALAQMTLERVDGMAAEYPGDFRLPMARLYSLAILGREDDLLAAGQQVLEWAPNDLLVAEMNQFEVALAYALAAADNESLSVLAPVIGPPYVRSVEFLVSAPAFAGLKDHPTVQAWLAEFRDAVARDRAAYDRERR